MLTPQEVSSRAFTKAVMGGYNMAMVDEFLDELSEDYAALYKENAALKAKMKVLVEKVEEYRATEDSMRATLLTAQRMADSIVSEAEAKRDQILAQAENGIKDQVVQHQQELAAVQARLDAGRQELVKFINLGKELCGQEIKFLEKLYEMEVSAPLAAAQEEQTRVDEIGENVMAAFAAQSPEGTHAAQPIQAPEHVSAEPENVSRIPDPSPADSFGEEPLEETRRLSLDDLKFGRNYVG